MTNDSYYNESMPENSERPAHPPHAETSSIVEIRLTDSERITYQKEAERCGQSLAEWIRQRLAQAAKREAKES
jgi:predicted HicB family RNase H-like nuclease